MKKVFSVLLAALLVCALTIPSFALLNGKYYKIGMPPTFSELKNSDGHMEWQNKKTGSSIIVNLEDNSRMLFYLGADEQTQQEFAKSFIESLQTDINNKTTETEYTINYGKYEYGEKQFAHSAGFFISCETTKKAKNGSYNLTVDSDFYFFSIKELVVKIECVLTSDDDKAAVEAMLNDFELDGTLLTAENVSELYPSPALAAIPVVVLVLIVVLIIVIKKKKGKAAAEAKEPKAKAEN